jgi:hypothetical protein
VDIAGAKALKERLGSKAGERAPQASVDVPEDAPPVYSWTGVSARPSDATSDETEAQPPVGGGASLFQRLRFSFR